MGTMQLILDETKPQAYAQESLEGLINRLKLTPWRLFFLRRLVARGLLLVVGVEVAGSAWKSENVRMTVLRFHE